MAEDKHITMGEPTETVPSTSSQALRQSGIDAILLDKSFLLVRLTCNHLRQDEADLIDAPSSPGPIHLGPVGSGQSHPNQATPGGHTTQEADQQPKEASPVLPFLSEEILAWLPASLRAAASDGLVLVQKIITRGEASNKEHVDYPLAAQFGIEKNEAIIHAWHTTLRALVEVATAGRDGRRLYNPPSLHNQITQELGMRVPDPDQIFRLHDNNQHIQGLPSLSAYTQQGQRTPPSPIIMMGMNSADARAREIAEVSEEIDKAMRLSSRSESLRRTQAVQLQSLLQNQYQTHTDAQGVQDLQDACSRADEARQQESEKIAQLIKKRSELLDKEV